MLFNSFTFWGFFAVVIGLYWFLPHRPQNRLLLVASYFFYGYWDWRFLGLIFASTVIDYFVAKGLDNSSVKSRRKKLLVISLAANLGMLGFFKYFGFFVTEMGALLELIGFQPNIPTLNIILPVGISFYTFQTMSYTIDVYYGRTKHTNHFLDFALYVSFFPQLIAGPIERSGKLLPQILNERKYQAGDFSEGLYHILFGLFKKIVIADNMAPIVNQVFSTPTSELTGPEVIVGVYAFAFQIYGDFSGYSSIAQGLAKWMGINLSWNFKMPYFARNPSDFWRRWHITLSEWLRDYLYISLGGSRKGRVKTLRNLMATMLLGGLWHGAAWTFIVWGFWHGLILVIYRLIGFESSGKAGTFSLRSTAQIILMFHLVCIGWLFFRAESSGQAFGMLALALTDFRFTDFVYYGMAMILFFITPMMALEYVIERKNDLLYLLNAAIPVRLTVYIYFIVMTIIFPPVTGQIFIYFQF